MPVRVSAVFVFFEKIKNEAFLIKPVFRNGSVFTAKLEIFNIPDDFIAALFGISATEGKLNEFNEPNEPNKLNELNKLNKLN